MELGAHTFALMLENKAEHRAANAKEEKGNSRISCEWRVDDEGGGGGDSR